MDTTSRTPNSLHPGYSTLAHTITSFLTTHAPPFIYITDPLTPRISASVISFVLSSLTPDLDATRDAGSGSSSHPPPPETQIAYAHVNAISAFTTRVLYDSILNALAAYTPSWEDGCLNWGAHEDGGRWNESFDTFVQGLRAAGGTEKGKGKGKEEQRKVIFIEHAERLKDTMPELIVPLTRLAELTNRPITTILLSSFRWEDLKPPLGAAPDPYYIDVPAPSKQAITEHLTTTFLSLSSLSSAYTSFSYKTYRPHLLPLYTHFSSLLISVCGPFTMDPDELGYIGAWAWPAFVKPFLSSSGFKNTGPNSGEAEGDGDGEMEEREEEETGENEESEWDPPSARDLARHTRVYIPQLTTALETLYPRLVWARPSDSPSPSAPTITTDRQTRARTTDGDALPRLSKFILVASFLASTNPPKSDLRMFGRGLDERKKRRRGGRRPGPNAKSSTNAKAKLPQRLLGPLPFPLERLLAVLGVLLEENDVDARLPWDGEGNPGEYTEMELGRVQVWGAIAELSNMRLLHRTSPAQDALGSGSGVVFKCGIGYDFALALARELDVPLNDLMWDPA